MKYSSENQRNIKIDFLKGIAIITVFFFHLKILTYGYLGVDVFFVIAGYLTATSIERKQDALDSLGYFSFLRRRLVRLMPLILLASLFCLIVGTWGMLPDDFENLAESVVASNLLSENLLQLVTTKNYWDVSQDYKPLMHLWYVGVLFEFYIIYPLIVGASDSIAIIVKRLGLFNTDACSEHEESTCVFLLSRYKHRAIAVAVCSAISLVLYIISFCFPMSRWLGADYRFYCIQFRFFEFGIGALCCFLCTLLRKNFESGCVFIVALIGLIGLLVSSFGIIPSGVKLVMVIFFSCCCILCAGRMPDFFLTRGIAGVGKRSYSIFIWHQVIIAFYRYYFSDVLNVVNFLTILGLTIVTGECTYRIIENGRSLHDSKERWRFATIGGGVLFAITTGFALLIYMKSGVIRDVPELGLYTNSSRRHMHKVYSERIYEYDRDYENNGKIKVFVTGVSYGRDFCNVILESKWGGYDRS